MKRTEVVASIGELIYYNTPFYINILNEGERI